jgi:hypothetical protein
MKGATRLPVLAVLAALLAAAPGSLPAAAQDAPPPGGLTNKPPPKPLTPEEQKEARKLFDQGKAMVEKGQGLQARALFEEFLKKYPGADEDMVQEAEDRGGPNFLAGIELQHDAGPPARRIDIELMADGYILDKFKDILPADEGHMKEFWAEPLYGEYENYFNVWRFDLVSKQDGVDEMTPEEKGMPPPDPSKKPPKPSKHPPKQFSTALNCKQAGPQNQVWADPEQVMRWRKYLKVSDGLTMAFAKKGSLGMGGGGIATTGPKGAVVHEFGHAFVNLLDEYAVNPAAPGGKVFAANAISTDDPQGKAYPPFEEVPWKHWLTPQYKEKYLGTGVGMFLGGATYKKGVFRPSAGCAMNSGGGGAYCWVCREAGVLAIYSYVSPLDESGPIADRVKLAQGESKELFVQPMQPKTHRIQVEWRIQVLGTAVDAVPPGSSTGGESVSSVEDDRAAAMWQREGGRAQARRDNPLPEGNPKGSPLKAVVKPLKGGAFHSVVKLENLPPGFYRVTARVFDDTVIPKDKYPWVIKDPDRLREEWRTWIVESMPAASAPPPAAPPPPGTPPKK